MGALQTLNELQKKVEEAHLSVTTNSMVSDLMERPAFYAHMSRSPSVGKDILFYLSKLSWEERREYRLELEVCLLGAILGLYKLYWSEGLQY